MGKIVNQTELAEIIGVTDVTLWEWQKAGMPVLERGARGTANRYDTAQVFRWCMEREAARAGKGESQRDREARLRGDMLEIELAKSRGVLVPAPEIEPVWTNRVMTAAALLSSRASRLAGLLEATPGIEAKRALLREEDAAFLNQLGVDGARMQRELEELLERVSSVEADAFLKRIAGDGASGSAGAH